MEKFARLPIGLISRFAELSKREIIILCFLHSSRNTATGKCCPKQMLIARETGIAQGHVSVAIKGLIAKGFVVIESGNYELQMPPEKVAKTVTLEPNKIYQNGISSEGENIPKRYVEYTDSVYQIYQNGISHYKEYIEQTKNRQGNRECFKERELSREAALPAQKQDAEILLFTPPEMPTEMAAVIIFQAAFPNQKLTHFQIKFILDRVSDIDVWREAVEFWAANDHNSRNVANLCRRYAELVNERKEGIQTNGTNQQINYRQERENEAVRNRNFFAALRNKQAERGSELKLLRGRGLDSQ